MTLDDADGNAVTLHSETGTRAVSNVTGLLGVGSLRDDRRVRPQAHGGLDLTRFEDGRLINVQAAVWSRTSQEDALSQMREITSAALQTLDSGPALLKWTEGDSGLELQRYVRLADALDPSLQEGAALLEYQAQFFAEDPRAYSQTLTTATGDTLEGGGGLTAPFTAPITVDPSIPGQATVNNTGTRPTPAVFRIYGYATSPTIVLVGEDKQIAITGDVAPGDYLEIDTQARTLKLNGTSPAQSYLDSSDTQWFELPKGTSTIRLLAGSNDSVARCDVLYRPAY